MFIELREREREGGREGGREEHQSMTSPDQGSNAQPFAVCQDAPTSRATLPAQYIIYLKKFVFSYS